MPCAEDLEFEIVKQGSSLSLTFLDLIKSHYSVLLGSKFQFFLPWEPSFVKCKKISPKRVIPRRQRAVEWCGLLVPFWETWSSHLSPESGHKHCTFIRRCSIVSINPKAQSAPDPVNRRKIWKTRDSKDFKN